MRNLKRFWINHDYRQFGLVLFLLAMAIGLTSCDSSGSIPIQAVDQSAIVNNNDSLTLNVGKRGQDKTLDTAQNSIYFGFDLRSSPQEDAAQYIPFLDYLSESTGFHFKLHLKS